MFDEENKRTNRITNWCEADLKYIYCHNNQYITSHHRLTAQHAPQSKKI